jgi:hypothetical protein
VSSQWILTLSDRNLDAFTATVGGEVEEQVLRVQPEAGLPYYIVILIWDSSSTT